MLQLETEVESQPSQPSSPIAALAHSIGDPGAMILASIESSLLKDEDPSDAIIALEATANANLRKPERNIWSFGDGRKGQLGHGDYEITEVPTRNPYLIYSVVMDIACGQEHMVAVTDSNNTYAWGEGSQGQISDILISGQLKPHWSSGLREVKVRKVFAGGWNSFALSEKNELYSWGWSKFGQLGRKAKSLTKPEKIGPPLAGKKIKSVAVGLAHALVLDEGGKVYAFGANAYGQLGDGKKDNLQLPRAVAALDGQNVIKVAAGCEHSLALTDDGDVWSWGNGDMGQLGHGRWESTRAPKRIDSIKAMGKVVKIAVGCHHSIAVLESNLVLAWGWNKWGQLGTGDTLNRPTPRLVDFFRGQFAIKSIAAGRRHTILLTEERRVFCWGANQYGQCGTPHPQYIKSPAYLSFFEGLGVSKLCAQGDYSAVISDILVAQGEPSSHDEVKEGNARAFAQVSQSSMHTLIQADYFSQEFKIDQDNSKSEFEKAELKLKIGAKIAKTYGVDVSTIVEEKVQNLFQSESSALSSHDKLVTQNQIQTQSKEGDIESAGDDSKDQVAEPTPTPVSGPGSLGTESSADKSPATLDELKSLGPVGSGELQGKEIPLPPPETIASRNYSLPRREPETSPTSPYMDWFIVELYDDMDCLHKIQEFSGKNSLQCFPFNGTTSYDSLSIEPSMLTKSLINISPFSDEKCSESFTYSVISANCGEECYIHESISGDLFWSIKCGFTDRTNRTNSLREDFIESSESFERHQKASETPFRHCDPNSDIIDTNCQITELDKFWHKVKATIEDKGIDVEEEKSRNLGPSRLTWVNVTSLTPRVTKVELDLPESPPLTTTTTKRPTGTNSQTNNNNNNNTQTDNREVIGGGKMWFDLDDDEKGHSVGVVGVEHPKVLELTDAQYSNQRLKIQPNVLSPIQQPKQFNPDSLFPPQNPLVNDLKNPNTLIEFAEGKDSSKDDDFDEFFQ